MHKDYYCAYHHSQIITTFCRCQDCLLPACSVCVKLHSQEHGLKKTKPQYQNLTIIFKKINGQMRDIQYQAQRLVQSLLLIQRKRKQEMKQVKDSISAKRSEFISNFQNCIRDLDQMIIKTIFQIQNNFIYDIEQIDEQILHIERQVQKEINGIQSEQSLKTLISYYQSNKFPNLLERVKKIQGNINQFNDKNITLRFGRQLNQKIKDMLNQFVIISQVGPDDTIS